MTRADIDSGLIRRLRDEAGDRQETGQYVVRRRILFVAKRLFAHFGYEGTSLANVASTADVSEDQLLQLFESKLRLMEGIFDDEWKTIGPRLEDIVLAAMNAREAILEVFAVLTHILDKDRDVAQLWLFESRCLRGEDGRVTVPECFSDFSTLITHLVVRSQMERTCPPAFNARVVASLLIAGMEGLIRDWLLTERRHPQSGTTPYSGAQLITVFDAAVSGLKP